MRICVGEEEKYGKHLEDGRGPDQSCKQGDDAPLKTHAKWERSFGYHGSEGLVLYRAFIPCTPGITQSLQCAAISRSPS
jgi:hypothetical protein